ncbi:unnamed protein product [Chondrus crispus]|uniref:Uncharacterized protein n=1 Tax=Chondrus crispus TaxID=2769 RepID=R7QA06_CHOCR|nr:unnamed protein product [Chondrus crispus]CDF34305.1 unnamed protein product [Chondrus crispus]|eukprot:XP_005714124.1 unnamed protein product [Chondrus crispus]
MQQTRIKHTCHLKLGLLLDGVERPGVCGVTHPWVIIIGPGEYGHSGLHGGGNQVAIPSQVFAGEHAHDLLNLTDLQRQHGAAALQAGEHALHRVDRTALVDAALGKGQVLLEPVLAQAHARRAAHRGQGGAACAQSARRRSRQGERGVGGDEGHGFVCWLV